MKADRSNFSYQNYKARHQEPGQDEAPRDYQSLTLKYGKYLDQSKAEKPKEMRSASPKFEHKNPYSKADVNKKEEVEDNSSTDVDEEEQMIKGNLENIKKRKKKWGKGKKTKEQEYMNLLQVVSLIMFMCGALGLISISALRFMAV